MRIGQGYDSHVLVPGRPLYLGGEEIPSELGALGHSDGDCLLHALIDALLGAFGNGDIGTLFPDADPAFKGVRSTVLLRRALTEAGLPAFRLGNMDATLFLDRPRVGPLRERIISGLARETGWDPSRLSLKAKTWEGIPTPRPVVAASVTLLLETP